MGINSLIYKELSKEYDEIRFNAQKELKKRQNEIYATIPRIQEIDEELSSIGLKITKAIISNPENAEEFILNLENENNKLKEEKLNLLIKNGYGENALTIKYMCGVCQDTGYIQTKQCKCMNQRLIDKLYSKSNLKEVLENENFSNFNKEYYSNISNEEGINSPRQNIEKVIEVCKKFCDNFEISFQNIMIHGKSGLGKTFLCNCIANELLNKGKTVLYLTSSQIFRTIEREKFNRTEEINNEFLDTLLSVDLLIIDDLGTEFNTQFTSSEFYNLVNMRLLYKKSTIISTNLAPSFWIDSYSDRVVSRIHGHYAILKLYGEDIRIQKKHA